MSKQTKPATQHEVEELKILLDQKNRELEIEAALERVRAKTMAMQQSNELNEVVAVLYEQMIPLGFAALGCELILCDKQNELLQYWTSSPEQAQLPECYTIPRAIHPFFQEVWQAWEKGTPHLVITLQGIDKRKFDKLIFEKTAFKNLPESVKQAIQGGKIDVFSLVTMKYGLLEAVVVKPLPKDKFPILERFAKVFEQTYTRFLDLQKAEAQAREAEIQLALERVRARAMSMHKSEELGEVSILLYEQLKSLGIADFFNCGYVEVDQKRKIQRSWMTRPDGSSPGIHQLPLRGDHILNKRYSAWKKQQEIFHQFVSGAQLKKHIEFVSPHFANKEIDKIVESLPDPTVFYCGNFQFGYLHIVTGTPLSKEAESILARFVKVFEQSYTRFLDLQKAEAQAREAQIEAALERIRARALAMHHSEELEDVAHVLREQMRLLDQPELDGCVVELYEVDPDRIESWYAFPSASPNEEMITGRSFFDKDSCAVTQEMIKKYKSPERSYTIKVSGEKLAEWNDIVLKAVSIPIGPSVSITRNDVSTMYYHCSDFSGGTLLTASRQEPLEVVKKLQERVASVFNLAYKRFRDLQKAEAQAREAQIEVALERVRSRSMAMHQSDELNEVATVLFQQIRHLGGKLWTCGIVLCQKDSDVDHFMVALENGMAPTIDIPNTKDPATKNMYTYWKKGADYYVEEAGGKDLKKHYDYLETLPTMKPVIENLKASGISLPTWQMWHAAYFTHGYLMIITLEPYPQAEVFKRFAKVFEQAYTRFLDLQKAEAQAREAQIEAALERVRARTMAMHHSEELAEVAELCFQQLEAMGVLTDRHRFGFGLMDEAEDFYKMWVTEQGGKQITQRMDIPLKGFPTFTRNYRKWKALPLEERKELDVICDKYTGKKLIDFLNYMAKYSDFSEDKLTQKILESPVDQWITYNAWFSHGGLNVSGEEFLEEASLVILQRFAKVFEQTYTRFLDLQKAEAQAREAQIEAALERVRSRSMAMHKSEELKETIQLVYEQMLHLNIQIHQVGFLLDYKDNDDWDMWMADAIQPIPTLVHFRLFDHPLCELFKNVKEKGLDFATLILSQKEKNRLIQESYKYILNVPNEIKETIYSYPGYAFSGIYLNNTALFAANFEAFPFSEEDNTVFKRFASVFEQTYTRFLDLQKAEAQAREAQIEVALERIRARSMAMHESHELKEVISCVFEQLQQLNFVVPASSLILYKEDLSAQHWFAGFSHDIYPESYTIPFIDTPYYTDMLETWKKGTAYGEFIMKEKAKVDYAKWLLTKTDFKNLPKEFVEQSGMLTTDSMYFADAFNKHGMIEVIGGEPLSENMADILKRISKVFEQTYTRFLDLQRAEAQAREAQIEAALEKVRSQSLAMHQSTELQQVVNTVFEQMNDLKIGMDHTAIVTLIEGSKDYDVWVGSALSNFNEFSRIPFNEKTQVQRDYNKAIDSRPCLFNRTYTGKIKKQYSQYLFSDTGFKTNTPKKELKLMAEGNTLTTSIAMQKNTGIQIVSYQGNLFSEDDNEILIRFAKVFEQAYIRFTDLKKAEAQTREAQIEAALERVRSKAMAMQHSDDLAQSVSTTLAELEQLDLQIQRCGVGIFNLEKQTVQLWTTTNTEQGKRAIVLGEVSLMKHPMLIGSYQSWLNKKGFSYVLEGNELRSYYDMLAEEGFALPADAVEKALSIGRMYYSYFAFRDGGLYVISGQTLSKEDGNIVQRFADVFHLAFTRYLDLQNAEARTREAVKQASLDRVRAEIASMRSKEDLARITPLIWKELTALEVPFIRCGVFIMDDVNSVVQTHLSTPDGKSLGVYDLPYEATEITTNLVHGWRNKKAYKEHWDKDQFLKFVETMAKRGFIQSQKVYKGSSAPPESLDLHFVPFKQGMLYVGNAAPLLEEELGMVQALAEAFSIAYARYEDFTQLEHAKNQTENTLGELKATQTQLIHAEKMASLGELTAGIAHEIQNPLNFVNNFSEVSKELAEELKEESTKAQLDKELIAEIATDIADNQAKINHHGQRASSIVKGMLEHSRTGTKEKELTDINALADEYLRLSYHGLRAKDKSFNADFKSDLDEKLPKVKVISQDIGRVILNMINNAFYAVSSKAKSSENEKYKPEVMVSTKLNDKKVEIVIQDNGDGIPKKNIDKIFQPFFTTKPTGQGTGLGLSLSYDIITQGHDGHLEVESDEGIGTRFIIEIPLTT